MNLKKDLPVAKFLLPTGVTMMILTFLVVPILRIFGLQDRDFVGYFCVIMFFLGFCFFILSLIDSSLSRERSLKNGKKDIGEQLNITNSPLVGVGTGIIVILILFSVIMMIAFSNFHP